MSIGQLKQFATLGSALLAVEHSDVLDCKISGCYFHLSKLGFEIASFFKVKDVEDLIQKQGVKLPVVIGFTTNQIITKEVPSFKKDNKDISLAFPNINQDDFYINRLYTNETCFVSICRKKVIDQYLSEYKDKGVKVVSFYLGNSYLNELSSVLDYPEVYSKTAKAAFSNNALLSLEKSSNDTSGNYYIEEESVPSHALLPVALGLHYLSAFSVTNINTEDENRKLKVAFKKLRIQKLSIYSSITLLLLLLTINSLLFSSIFKKVEKLQQNQQSFEIQKELITRLQGSHDKKKQLVQSIQKTGFSNSSQIINEVLENIPKSILLETLEYQPLEKKIRADKPIVIGAKKLLIIGKTSDKDNFFDWVKTIEAKPFVSNLNIEDFQDASTRTARFEILALLK